MILRCTAVSALVFAVMASSVHADYVRIPHWTVEKVDAHGVCRQIGNLSGRAIMVPFRSADEWSVGSGAFLNTEHAKIDLYACNEDPPWVDYGNYEYKTCTSDVEDFGTGGGRDRTKFTITTHKAVNGVVTTTTGYSYRWGAWSCYHY